MKIALKWIIVSIFSFLILLLVSCTSSRPRYERTLGTVCFVNLFKDGKDSNYEEIFTRLRQIDDEFNISKEYSDIRRINDNAVNKPVPVSDDVYKVLETAQKVSEMTDGAFDATVAPLVLLWSITSPYPHVATQEEIDERLPFVDYKNIILNPKYKTVRLAKKGVSIELGAIAKGFAADEVAKICQKNKIRRAVIDLGGNIYVFGSKSKATPWNVGVKNPELPDSPPLLKLTLPQISVVTSGMYERYFDEGQERYHHILSPKDGYPVNNDLLSVSVISENSMLADALTTAFFVTGKQRALELLPRFKEEFGVELSAIFIEKNHTVSLSENFPYPCAILYNSWSFGDNSPQ